MKHSLLPILLGHFALSLTPLHAEEDPLAPIKAQVKDHAAPFSMLVEFTVKPESRNEFLKLCRESVKQTRLEEGNLGYEVHEDSGNPNKLVFWEKWASVAALETHVKFDYVQALLGKAAELCEGEPVIRVLKPLVPAIKPGTVNKRAATAGEQATKPAEDAAGKKEEASEKQKDAATPENKQ